MEIKTCRIKEKYIVKDIKNIKNVKNKTWIND